MPEQPKRKYELKLRAEQQQATRRRIVDAAVDLHGSIGPARTTITAIAARAGVPRLTVYRHFPDERTLFEACSARGRGRMPPPEIDPWRAIADPSERLETALPELYAYFRDTAQFWSNILRDAEVMPIVREMAFKRRLAYLDEARDTLAVGWGVRGRRHRLLLAAIGLTVDFRTWETLTSRQGLDDGSAIALMTQQISCIAHARLPTAPSPPNQQPHLDP